jgi:hypothetical protein
MLQIANASAEFFSFKISRAPSRCLKTKRWVRVIPITSKKKIDNGLYINLQFSLSSAQPTIPIIHDFSAVAIPIQDMDLKKKKKNHQQTLVRNPNFQNKIQLLKPQIKIWKKKKKWKPIIKLKSELSLTSATTLIAEI